MKHRCNRRRFLCVSTHLHLARRISDSIEDASLQIPEKIQKMQECERHRSVHSSGQTADHATHRVLHTGSSHFGPRRIAVFHPSRRDTTDARMNSLERASELAIRSI
ncbi:hypothetical protein TGP89_421630 [Toxoplasma gondii p89]|uniref:Uncharacterized protein n=1 Tax=Toxoplasma gondii p89 TaxID=943119 RepID=A0A086J7D9_TOXGO|nr:hypothetical protein TGP89_421630 [Toxoplasma gondii p89]